MYCASCQSNNQTEFFAEMMIHFSGLKHIENRGVLAFQKVLVCLDCGFARFTASETELHALREGIVASPSLFSSQLAVGVGR